MIGEMIQMGFGLIRNARMHDKICDQIVKMLEEEIEQDLYVLVARDQSIVRVIPYNHPLFWVYYGMSDISAFYAKGMMEKLRKAGPIYCEVGEDGRIPIQ